MKNWIGVEFGSSSGKTPEFKAFAKDFKKYLKKLLGEDYRLADFHAGHFYLSGFIFDKSAEKYAYFMISDVRFFQDQWFTHLLVRTALTTKDFTGGTNRHCKLDEIVTLLKKIYP